MPENKKKKQNKKFPFLWAAVYGVLLTGYTVFTLLHAFVIPSDIVYVDETEGGIYAQTGGEDSESVSSLTDDSSSGDTPSDSHRKKGNGRSSSDENSDSQETDGSESAEPVYDDTSYESESFSVSIETITVSDTQVYVADVQIKDITSFRAGLAEGAFGRNLSEKTSEIAEDNNAVFAVNGDYYGFRDKGYVMRNGYLYRDTSRGEGNEDLVVYADGSMEIIDESQVTADELVNAGAVQIFSFGPGLVTDGEISVSINDEVDQSKTSNPRTAVGMIEPLHYIFVVSDGRTDESEGLTLYELAGVMKDYGCTQAYNLDGGGSSTMWFMGRVVNNPTSSGNTIKERSVSDIVYIG